MAVSKLLPTSGSNDFNIAVTGPDTAVTFDKEYAAGAYTITISGGDTSFDLYAYSVTGSIAGYTNTAAFTASIPFIKIVIIGQTAGNLLSFAYKKTYTTTATSNEVTAGPVVTSVSPSALPKINDTLVVTGKNFATNCTVTFTSANTAYSPTAAKSVVRSSATSLIVTRPDDFPTAYSPYTLTVSNPGITNPTGSNSHILSNGVSAGASPLWSTSATLPVYTKNVSYSTTLVATDADAGSAITYSVVSNTLPAGLSFNTSTGVISGTPTGTTNGGITVRATDSGGNFVDRAFTLNNIGPDTPVWVTAAGQLTNATISSAYSVQLQATDDSGVNPTFSLISGTLPTGLSLSASGLISGTPTAGNGNANFTVRITDQNGSFADRIFKIGVAVTYNVGPYFGGGTSDSGNWGDANMGTIFVPTYSGTITRVRALNNATTNPPTLGNDSLRITTAASTTNPNVDPSSAPVISSTRTTYSANVSYSGGTKNGVAVDFDNLNYAVTAGQGYVINFKSASTASAQMWATTPTPFNSTGGYINQHWSLGNGTVWTAANDFDSYVPAMGITYVALT